MIAQRRSLPPTPYSLLPTPCLIFTACIFPRIFYNTRVIEAQRLSDRFIYF